MLRNKRPKIYANAFAHTCICISAYMCMRMCVCVCVCVYTLHTRMLISIYELAYCFFLFFIVHCSFNGLLFMPNRTKDTMFSLNVQAVTLQQTIHRQDYRRIVKDQKFILQEKLINVHCVS